jgi:uncharacterized protein (TIGR02569 family)
VQPPPEVLDLFAVPDHVTPLSGGQGRSSVAGDLVLSPGRDAATSRWLNPVLARLAVELDSMSPRTLRIAMPSPSRDGRWVVDGWGASRYEPHSHHCRELDVLVATGRLLHARLASALPTPPAGIGERSDRWARAERAAFDGRVPEGAVSDATGTHGIPLEHAGPLVTDLAAHLAAHLAALDDTELGPDQLVHADLAGNVLLDGRGVPVVIDVAPCWRPALWAEAVCVLDAVLWHGASPSVMGEWTRGAARQAMLRAGLFRLLSDDPAEPTLSRYRTLLLDPPGTSGH